MIRVRNLTILLAIAFCMAAPLRAQLGKTVIIPAGSEVDHQLNDINAATDPAQKLKLIDAFAPLLKSNNAMYARNQYRLGFAYLNLKKAAEAKQAFTDAASVDSPFKGPAQEKLKGITAARPAAKKPA